MKNRNETNLVPFAPDSEASDPAAERLLTRAGFMRGAAALSMGALAAGCGSSSSQGTTSSSFKRGGVLQIATDQMFEGDSLDPILAINDGQAIAQGMIRETLSNLDADQRPIPGLATWDTNAGFTEYTLHIKPGVKFHSGKTLTASDAAFSIKRQLDPKLGSGLLARLSPSLSPDGIQVVNDTTLRLRLKRPDALIMSPLARQWAMVCPDGTTDFANGDGTGPFRLRSWVAGQSCQVDRFDGYWNSGLPYLNGVEMLQISEAATKTESLLSGPSDVTEIDYQSLPLIRGQSSVKMLLGENFHLLNVAMQQNSHPYNDPRVREALKRSVDRQKLIRIAYAGYGTVAADTPVPTVDPQYPASLNPRLAQNLAQAHSLMHDAGYPNGMQITLPVSNDTLHATFAIAFAASVAGSPFTITVQQHPANTYWNQIWLHTPIMVSDWNRRTALEAFGEMLQGPQNEPQFNNPQATQLAAEGFSRIGASQTAVVQPLLTLVSETSGDVIPAYRHRIFVMKDQVNGMTINPTFLYDLSRVSLD